MRVAHPEVRLGSGGPPEGPVGVGRPTQRSERGQEAHQDVREGSGRPPGGSRGVKRPIQRGQESQP